MIWVKKNSVYKTQSLIMVSKFTFFTIVIFLAKQNLADILISENFHLKFLESLFGRRLHSFYVLYASGGVIFQRALKHHWWLCCTQVFASRAKYMFRRFSQWYRRITIPSQHWLLPIFQGKEELLQMESDARQLKVCLRWSSSIFI